MIGASTGIWISNLVYTINLKKKYLGATKLAGAVHCMYKVMLGYLQHMGKLLSAQVSWAIVILYFLVPQFFNCLAGHTSPVQLIRIASAAVKAPVSGFVDT